MVQFCVLLSSTAALQQSVCKAGVRTGCSSPGRGCQNCRLSHPWGFWGFSTFTDSKSQPWKASGQQAGTVPAFVTSYLFSGVQSQEIWVGGHMFCPWTKYPCVVYHHMDSEGEKRHLCTSCQGCPKCFVCM